MESSLNLIRIDVLHIPVTNQESSPRLCSSAPGRTPGIMRRGLQLAHEAERRILQPYASQATSCSLATGPRGHKFRQTPNNVGLHLRRIRRQRISSPFSPDSPYVAPHATSLPQKYQRETARKLQTDVLTARDGSPRGKIQDEITPRHQTSPRDSGDGIQGVLSSV